MAHPLGGALELYLTKTSQKWAPEDFEGVLQHSPLAALKTFSKWMCCFCRAIPAVWLGLSGRISGKTPEMLSERFLEFPSRVRLGSPRFYNSGIWGFQNISRILSPSVRRVGTPLFSEIGSGEGLSELLSWNSQQYWGYVWFVTYGIGPQPRLLARRPPCLTRSVALGKVFVTIWWLASPHRNSEMARRFTTRIWAIRANRFADYPWRR